MLRSLFLAGHAAIAASLVLGCPGNSLAPLGGECSRPGRGTAAGCRTGLRCSFGRCRDECETSRDCDAGRRCLVSSEGNTCSLEAEDTCRSATDCGGDLECASGECRTSCEDGMECGTGGTCSSGTCAEPVSMSMPDGSPCTSDEGCRGGSLCALDRCRPACSEGCDRGTRCLSDMGTLGCSLPDEDDCSGPTDCPDGLVCAGGECRTECVMDSDCAPGGRCTMSSCDEPMSVGPADAGPRPDAPSGPIPDAPLPGFDTGPTAAQSELARAMTGHPSVAQGVTVLANFLSPSFPARNIILGSMQAPIGVSLTARPDADGRGVGYAAAVDGTGAARVYRFSADAPEAAVDRSSELAAATNLIDIALLEDGATVRAMLLRDRSADMPATQAGWVWEEGAAPTPFDRTLGSGGHGVYTFGSAAMAGGTRSIGPDEELRYLVRERERISVGTDPVTYEPGAAFLSVLDAGRRQAASDRTESLFMSDVLVMRGLIDFALVWDPETRLSAMLRLNEEGGTLRTSFERLGFIDPAEAPPVIAQAHLNRAQALVAVPDGSSTTVHQISCPTSAVCVTEATMFLPTPGGTSATQLAAAPLRDGYALFTVDSEGIVLRVLRRDLSVVPGYDDGMPLEPLGDGILRIDGGSYNLMDLEAYAIAYEDVGGIRSVTLLVSALYTNFTAMQSRVWIGGVRAVVP